MLVKGAMQSQWSLSRWACTSFRIADQIFSTDCLVSRDLELQPETETKTVPF